MSRLFRKTGILLMILALFSTISMTAFAYTLIDTDKEVSLSLEYVSESTPLSGADFRIYKIADISSVNQYTLTEKFGNYSVSVEDLDSAGWLNLATTLTAYASRDGIEPTANGTTDSTGTLAFDELEVGLYLVEGDNITIGNCTYIPTPFIISLPNLNTEDVWEYDVTVEIKFGQNIYVPAPSGPSISTINISAVKVWKDDESENRPESVTVQLLRNGTVYEEVTLSEENGWSYTWYSLNADNKWQLTEKDVPEGYTVSVSKDDQTFTVTNTLILEEPSADDDSEKEPETEPPVEDNTQPGEEEEIKPEEPDDSDANASDGANDSSNSDSENLDNISGDGVPAGAATSDKPDDSSALDDSEFANDSAEDSSNDEDTPKTGDNSIVWLAVSLLSGAGIVTLLVFDKKISAKKSK